MFANRYFERIVQIERYREAIEYLCDIALNPRDSAILITQIRSTHGGPGHPTGGDAADSRVEKA